MRLAQELADLSNALPSEHTNAIFVRVDRHRHGSILRCVPLILNDAEVLTGTIKYLDKGDADGPARPILFTGP